MGGIRKGRRNGIRKGIRNGIRKGLSNIFSLILSLEVHVNHIFRPSWGTMWALSWDIISAPFWIPFRRPWATIPAPFWDILLDTPNVILCVSRHIFWILFLARTFRHYPTQFSILCLL